VQLVSTVRHLAPLVVDEAHPDAGGLTLSGSVAGPVPDGVSLDMVLTATPTENATVTGAGSAGTQAVLRVDHRASRWSLRLENGDVVTGRHRAVVRISFRGLRLDFPVVTARMPLPPVPSGVQLQPLADRADGWRFLVDRRVPSGHFARRLLRATRSVLRN